MALDRQSIEKKDFPVGRRGYDPDAVDAHLSALADEFTEFKRSTRRRADTLASSASEQVRAIVEAAETSASDIQRDAENDAREIRDEASAEAKSTREQATEQAREYVSTVSESTSSMLERVDAMESELSALIESLRTGGNRLQSDLHLLQTHLSEVDEAVTPRRSQFEPEESEADSASAAPVADGAEEDLYEPPSAPGDEGYGEPTGEGGEEAAAESGEAASDDAEGARLIALNMALNGTPRDETARYLSENFHLADSNGLLDEVYASVEG